MKKKKLSLNIIKCDCEGCKKEVDDKTDKKTKPSKSLYYTLFKGGL